MADVRFWTSWPYIIASLGLYVGFRWIHDSVKVSITVQCIIEHVTAKYNKKYAVFGIKFGL
jgi:hypothetical protein